MRWSSTQLTASSNGSQRVVRNTLPGPVINRGAVLESEVGDRPAELSGVRNRLFSLFAHHQSQTPSNYAS
jgi:hypothetical protein